MREYLFHGKRVYDGEWIEGCLIHQDNHYLILQDESKLHPMDVPYIDDFGCIDGRADPVVPESVGQYTGMKDKNSRKIFEGDIIERVWFGALSTYKIVFDDGIGAFIGESQNMKFTTFDYDSDCFEVIGNVFENADLLEGDV